MDSESNDSFMGKILGLFQRLIYDIVTSPINLILVVLIVFLLVKLLRLKRKPNDYPSSVKMPPQLPKMPKQDLTVEQLRGYNGVDSNGRILTAIYGDIFDVSRRSDLYGPGKSSLFFSRYTISSCFSLTKVDRIRYLLDVMRLAHYQRCN